LQKFAQRYIESYAVGPRRAKELLHTAIERVISKPNAPRSSIFPKPA